MPKLMIILLLASTLSIQATRALAADDDDESSNGTVTSMHAYSQKNSVATNASSEGMAGEYAAKNDRLDEAITKFRKSLQKDEDDTDLHLGYAQALEDKLRTQDDQDPYLFNQCVKEWLGVYRSESGEDKGIGFKGISIPYLHQFYEDEEHMIEAKRHLVSLVGRVPKGWETDAKYLQKVLVPATQTVRGKLIKDNSPE